MNRLLGMISLSRKAGKLQVGFDAAAQAVETGEAVLILFAADISASTKTRMEKRAGYSPSPPVCLNSDLSMDALADVCGKSAGVLAVTDRGLAAAIKRLAAAENEEEHTI